MVYYRLTMPKEVMLLILSVLPATLHVLLATITAHYLYNALHAHVVLVLMMMESLLFSLCLQGFHKIQLTEGAIKTVPLVNTIASNLEPVWIAPLSAHLATWV